MAGDSLEDLVKCPNCQVPLKCEYIGGTIDARGTIFNDYKGECTLCGHTEEVTRYALRTMDDFAHANCPFCGKSSANHISQTPNGSENEDLEYPPPSVGWS